MKKVLPIILLLLGVITIAAGIKFFTMSVSESTTAETAETNEKDDGDVNYLKAPKDIYL